ncbi:MAG: hypothetical protein F6K65_15665 [Moorea sp. SIO3C2]|nr:hypothetical protein [Moorena sp. SIO3C2]
MRYAHATRTAISYQLSAISYQLSAISYQLSAISQKLVARLRECLTAPQAALAFSSRLTAECLRD